MRQVLLIIDVQPCFTPPAGLVDGINALLGRLPSVTTVERHDENVTLSARQRGRQPAPEDDSLIAADRTFIKHGYAPTPKTIRYLKSLAPNRVLVCGIQADTCVLAAGLALFDAGLQPTLISDLSVGSSLDRSGKLGVDAWQHHFGNVVERAQVIATTAS
ncbi:isochorismatase family protein [Pseudomonas antarctica]|uniref:isochorismatase family protein n=1 Tax=Pseudomonas antarctica TaxID=219572 RepID=UPI0039C10A9D